MSFNSLPIECIEGNHTYLMRTIFHETPFRIETAYWCKGCGTLKFQSYPKPTSEKCEPEHEWYERPDSFDYETAKKYGLVDAEKEMINRGDHLIPVIKAIRTRTGFGLKDAKDMYHKYKDGKNDNTST